MTASHIGLLERKIPNHAQLSCMTHCAAYIQLILRIQRKLDLRIGNIALNHAALMSDDGDASGRAVASYCHGNGIACAFKLCAHHRDSKQRSA